MCTKMLRVMMVLMVLGSLGLMSCGKSNDDDWASGNIAGKVVMATIATGSPVLATTGSFTMTFNANGSYGIVGDGVNVANSQGTYTYDKTGADIGEITLTDGTIGITIKITLTYTDEAEGDYSASVTTTGVPGAQTGTFTEE
jgi:hypothetical protein